MLKSSWIFNCRYKLWNTFKVYHHNAYPASFLNLIRNLPPIQCSRLENGLTVATQERDSCNTCIGVYIDAGSRYEAKVDNGITHFVEHIVFKETKLRSKSELEHAMITTGAKFQCFTTREMSAYYVDCLSSEVPTVFNILIDCIFNNTLSHTEIENEKYIVYLEMLEHDKNNNNVLFDYLHSAAFQGTPLEQTVMGPSANLANFNAKNLYSVLTQRFVPKKMVLAAVGGITHDYISNMANEYLYNICSVKYNVDDMNMCRYTGSELRYRDDSQVTPNVAIAVEGPSYCHKDYMLMKLSGAIIGGWDRSQPGSIGHGTRIARNASCGDLCDSYKFINISYKDTSLWGVHFLGKKLDLDDMVYIIQDEWMRLCTTMTDEELERGKNQLITELLSKSGSTTGTCHQIGRSILYRGRYDSLLEIINRIDKIRAKDVRAACEKYIYDKCPVVAAIGPTESLPDYTRIRSGMYWLRV